MGVERGLPSVTASVTSPNRARWNLLSVWGELLSGLWGGTGSSEGAGRVSNGKVNTDQKREEIVSSFSARVWDMTHYTCSRSSEIGKDASALPLHLASLHFQPHPLPSYRYLKRSDDRLLTVSIFFRSKC